MSENAAPSTHEAVEELLGQLVDARFVLTDRDGAVTRWSRPAEELFGWPGARMLGQPLVQTLELGIGLPDAGGQLTATARRKDGAELELALTFVPVRMSQSLEFNGFLEALEIAAPRGNALGQLQQSHRTVVDWIAAAIAGQAEVEEEGLAAGTIVAFRPLREPPPAAEPGGSDEPGAAPAGPDGPDPALDAELAAARAEASELREDAALASERLQRLEDADAHRASELEDARRVLEETASQVEGLRGEMERTRAAGEELAREERSRARRDAEDGQAERERVRRQLDALQGTVDELRRDLAGAPAEQERLRAQLEETREQVGALESALADAGDRGAAEAAAAALEEELARLETQLFDTRDGLNELAREGARAEQLAELRERIDGIADRVSPERLAEDRARLDAQLAETRSRIEQLEAARSQEREHVRAELAAARGRIEELEHSLTYGRGEDERRLRGELEETRRLVESLGARIEEVQVEAVGDEEARALLGDMREELSRLRAGALESAVDAAEMRNLAEQVREVAAASEQTQAAIERLAGRAEEAADAARSHSSNAYDAAGAAEARAMRAEQAIEAAEAEAGRAERAARELADAGGATDSGATREELAQLEARSARAHETARETLETIASEAARAREVAAEAAARADRVETQVAAIESRSVAMEERLGAVEGQAGQMDERLAELQEHSGRLDDRLAAAEREGPAGGPRGDEVAEVARRAESAASAAEQAAAAAAEAAALARRSAEEADAARRAVEEAGTGMRAERDAAGPAAGPARTAPDGPDVPHPANGNGAQGEDTDPRRPLFGRKRDTGPARELRPGFDDADQPMATIDLDGHFRELNRAFTELVGYSEQDFKSASWPPVMDRANLPKHREQMKLLVAGEIDTAEVNTGYVHAQGLLVPVVGTISLVRSGGEPDHFLLAAKS